MASPQQPAPPSNPFDGFDTKLYVAQQPPAQTAPQQQWAQQPPTQQQQQQPPAVSPSAANPFAAQPPVAAATSPTAANPFALPPGGLVPPPAAQPVAQPVPQLAYAPHQQPQLQPHQQQLATLPPSAIVQSPWALQNAGGVPPAAPAPTAGGQTYDPLGVFGAPTPQPPPQQMQPAFQQPGFQAQQQPGFQPQQQPGYNPQYALPPQQPAQPQPPSAQQKLQAEVQQFNLETQQTPDKSILPNESEDEGLALVDVELDDASGANEGENLESRKKDGEFLDGAAVKSKKSPRSKSGGGGGGGRGRNSWDRNPDIAPPPPITPGRRHAEYLADNSAPRLSSPLPKQELVHHSGYVLSRISFRTVLMRKWKQTFWIQYGPTQLLFFRSFSDYEDWLNNPYHTQKAREFLVKLRVDFVSDLKKSSVMGYQVTQVRRKPYGKNVMLHFKLERWMDYGPTIAAAFAAREEEMMNSPSHRRHGDDEDGMNTSNDVSALRKIILGCMRNARDAAMVTASRGQQTDMGEAVGYRGRYDEDHQREGRIPATDRNLGYHQAFSAESSERRRMDGPDMARSPSTESSQEGEVETAEALQPVVDLLG